MFQGGKPDLCFLTFVEMALPALSESLKGVDTQNFPGSTPHTPSHFSSAGSAVDPNILKDGKMLAFIN